jgi:Cu2+-exporting ATPase
VRTLQLNVPTVHCKSCKLTIEETLEELDGVVRSDVDLDTKQVTVAYEADTVEITSITASIEEAGYTVEL